MAERLGDGACGAWVVQPVASRVQLSAATAVSARGERWTGAGIEDVVQALAPGSAVDGGSAQGVGSQGKSTDQVSGGSRVLEPHAGLAAACCQHVATGVDDEVLDVGIAQDGGDQIDETSLSQRPDIEQHGLRAGQGRPFPGDRRPPHRWWRVPGGGCQRVVLVVAEVFQRGGDRGIERATGRVVELVDEREHCDRIRGEADRAALVAELADQGVGSESRVGPVEVLDRREDRCAGVLKRGEGRDRPVGADGVEPQGGSGPVRHGLSARRPLRPGPCG